MGNLLRAVLIFWFGTALGASHYLDGALSTGSGDGSSWANAWTNPLAVNWASVSAGDTLFISGGSASFTYTNTLGFPNNKSGTSGAWITVSPGRDAGHNGMVIFNAATISSASGCQFVWINGAKSLSFVDPTNRVQVTTGSSAITNNIGIRIQNLYSEISSDTSPVVWYWGDAPMNNRISYVEVAGVSNAYAILHPGSDWHGSILNINGNGDPSTNNTFEYLFLHDCAVASFISSAQTAIGFDCNVFKFGIILNNFEDTFNLSAGWTIRDSVLGPLKTGQGTGHADMFQWTGDFIKVYNNDIRESLNSIQRLQTYATGGGNSVRHDMYWFNNLVTEKQGRAEFGGTWNEMLCHVNFDPLHTANYVAYSNIFYFNNLFYNSVYSSFSGAMAGSPVLNFSRGTGVTNAEILSVAFMNNLVIEKHKGIGFPFLTNSDSANGYYGVTTNTLKVLYNVFAGTNRDAGASNLFNARNLAMIDSSTNAEFSPYKFNNVTNFPVLSDVVNDNFEIVPSDTVAHNTGTNLSSVFTALGYASPFDSLNRARPASGAWDMGPLQQTVDPALKVWFTFQDNFDTTNKVLDFSGNNHWGQRLGKCDAIDPSHTNWPTRILTSAGAPGVISNGYCASFHWFTNSAYSSYHREGQYIAITNINSISNLNQMTVCIWARMRPTDFSPGGYFNEQSTTLVSAGIPSGNRGTFTLARDYTPNTLFEVLTNGSPMQFMTLNFPDANSVDGNTTNWNHYAFTWSNGVASIYFNGTNIASQNQSSSAVTNLIIAADNGVVPYMSLGVETHGGSPIMDDTGVCDPGFDDYPNNGWNNSVMQDFRLYNRALSPSEILTVFQGGGSGSGGGGGGGVSAPSQLQIGNGTISIPPGGSISIPPQ